jgi:hypothetical protein
MPGSDKQPIPGFILAATLWIVAILALVAAYITSWVGDSLDRGYVRQAKVEAFRESEEARATALYWLSTRFMSQRGVELLSGADLTNAAQRDPFSAPVRGKTWLALDDRPYKFGKAVVHLQDARGLFNLNSGSDEDLGRLLGDYGIPVVDRQPMIAKLHDYIEPGPFKRLNGAKAREYQDAGQQPPTGQKLVTPWEARHVLDWTKIDPDGFGRSSFYEQVTTVSTAGLNLNTAPAEILDLVPGMTSAAVAKIIAARQIQPFVNTAQVAAVGDVAIPRSDFGYFFLPLNSLRISITVPGDPLERVMAVHTTSASPEQPWQIDYIFDVPPFADHRLTPDQKPGAAREILDFPDPAHPPTAP